MQGRYFEKSFQNEVSRINWLLRSSKVDEALLEMKDLILNNQSTYRSPASLTNCKESKKNYDSIH